MERRTIGRERRANPQSLVAPPKTRAKSWDIFRRPFGTGFWYQIRCYSRLHYIE